MLGQFLDDAQAAAVDFQRSVRAWVDGRALVLIGDGAHEMGASKRQIEPYAVLPGGGVRCRVEYRVRGQFVDDEDGVVTAVVQLPVAKGAAGEGARLGEPLAGVGDAQAGESG